ncbi:hypothetical protein [Amycolatopsis thailandensis]|uniref:hypothetical protein n=1 Tax=Amycolatopsis thailandensis TaxID=589330 RepID=UPI001177BFA1|nr:hypothetical protein [Amycolatopsis thailandensis]
MRGKFLLCTLFSVLLLGGTVTVAGAREAAPVDLGAFRGDSHSHSTGINDAGGVVGEYSTVAERTIAVRWNPDGTHTRLAIPAGVSPRPMEP